MAQHVIKIVDNPISPTVTHDFAFAGSLADAQTKARVLVKVYRNRSARRATALRTSTAERLRSVLGPTKASRGASLLVGGSFFPSLWRTPCETITAYRALELV